ncbi:MAG: hypothetical protein ABIX44_01895 [Cryobacterium sp.]
MAVGVVLGVVWGGAASPASATDDSILLSTDGVHFATSIRGGIFEDLGVLVPGDSVESALWIRNPTNAPAMLRVSARNVIISSADFADGVTMSSWDSKTGATTTIDLHDIADCGVLAPAQEIDAGESIKTVLRFTMSDLEDDTAMDAGVNLDMMVTMRDAAAGAFPPSACEDDGVLISSSPGRSGPLPRTGADPAAPLVVAGLLVGLGACLARGRARRGARES